MLMLICYTIDGYTLGNYDVFPLQYTRYFRAICLHCKRLNVITCLPRKWSLAYEFTEFRRHNQKSSHVNKNGAWFHNVLSFCVEIPQENHGILQSPLLVEHLLESKTSLSTIVKLWSSWQVYWSGRRLHQGTTNSYQILYRRFIWSLR